jgi:hypothetical protein
MCLQALMPTVTQQSLLHAAGNVGGNVAFGAGCERLNTALIEP